MVIAYFVVLTDTILFALDLALLIIDFGFLTFTDLLHLQNYYKQSCLSINWVEIVWTVY